MKQQPAHSGGHQDSTPFDRFITADGLTLRTRSWTLEAEPRGSIALIHGLGEHSGRYDHVAAYLNQSGWNVFAYDLRGHGLSEGPRGDIATQECLLHDLGLFLSKLKDQGGSKPMLLLGHSLGGLIVARYAALSTSRRPPSWYVPVDGVAVSSPPVDAGLSLIQRLLVETVSRWIPHVSVKNGLKPEWICNNPPVVEAYRNDPLVHDRISGELVRFIATGGAKLMEKATSWSTPMLLMWSGNDRCLNSKMTPRFAQRLPADMVTRRLFPDFGHEIFNEAGNHQVFSTLGHWLNRF